MNDGLRIRLGVKTDPIEYRYSFDWLFRILADEGVGHVQLGSFSEVYRLEDDYFRRLRDTAQSYGVRFESLFTAHRELGGFFIGDPAWERVARRNYERYIEVGALLGASRVGSNPGAILRDRMEHKADGIACYVAHMKELLAYAYERGISCLTMEPMSCLAEPPATPEEIVSMAGELGAYHIAHPATAAVGYCADTSHGLADAQGKVLYDHMALFEATFPWLVEFHVKNTDALFSSTFGFSEAERRHGIVDLAAVRGLLHQRADTLPQQELTAYLEIGGPKLGRDYSDVELETQLRDSLRHMKAVFSKDEG